MGVGSPSADLDRLVDGVYEAAIVSELWPKALAEMAGLADAAFASLLTFDGSVLRWTGTPEAMGSSIASRRSRRRFPIAASCRRFKRSRLASSPTPIFSPMTRSSAILSTRSS
jgi:hypothetical protein